MHTPVIDIDPGVMPTRETYDPLQHAYGHYNFALFDGGLPNCLITLQRKGRSYGFFHHKRFARKDGRSCDEIALNPAFFESRKAEEVLSTLVHEMVHLWQHYYGAPGRGRYHNRQWAEKMKSVGLYPSHTGEEGGDELGDQMTHYILDDGPFAKATGELIQQGFKIKWRQAAPEPATEPGGGKSADPKGLPAPGGNGTKAGKRIKYTCPVCGLNVWGKHGAKADCHEHKVLMLPAGQPDS